MPRLGPYARRAERSDENSGSNQRTRCRKLLGAMAAIVLRGGCAHSDQFLARIMSGGEPSTCSAGPRTMPSSWAMTCQSGDVRDCVLKADTDICIAILNRHLGTGRREWLGVQPFPEEHWHVKYPRSDVQVIVFDAGQAGSGETVEVRYMVISAPDTFTRACGPFFHSVRLLGKETLHNVARYEFTPGGDDRGSIGEFAIDSAVGDGLHRTIEDVHWGPEGGPSDLFYIPPPRDDGCIEPRRTEFVTRDKFGGGV